MSLPSLASAFREAMLAFVWRQWTQLGVAGVGTQSDPWCQDPEALLLFSLEITRQEPRSFDEILDWLVCNDQTMMLHRVKHLVASDPEMPRNVIDAALARAGVVKRTGSIDDRQSLFPMFDMNPGEISECDDVFLQYGLLRPPFQPSGKSQPVRLSSAVAFAFKLRAVFGNSARAEALRFLLLNRGQKVGTAEIAEAALLTRFGVQQTLEELHHAGLIRRGLRGRKDLVWWIDTPHPLAWLMPGDGEQPAWVAWPTVYRGLACLWRWLLDPLRDAESSYMLASGARALMRQVEPLVRDRGLRWRASNAEGQRGAAYLETFTEDVLRLVACLSEQPAAGPVRYETVAETIAHRKFSLARTIEVPSGELAVGSVTGRALDLSLRWRAFHEATATLRCVEVTDEWPLAPDQPGWYEGREEDGKKIELHDTLVVGHSISFGSELAISNVKLKFRSARIAGQSQSKPSFLRFILGNLGFDPWPDGTSTADGWSRDSLLFSFQSRVLRLTALQAEPAVAALVLDGVLDPADGLAIAYDCASLFSFLMDTPVKVLAMEAYDGGGELAYETLFPDNGPASDPRYQPIRWIDLEGYSSMSTSIGVMLERYVALKNKLDLPAVFGTLVTSSVLPVEVELLLKVAAIKKLAKTWSDWQEAGSNGRRSSNPLELSDALGVPLDDAAAQVLRASSEAVEDGSVLSTAATPAELQAKVLALGTIRTFANACLLRLLGYEGPMRDYGRFGYPTLVLGPPAKDGLTK